MRISKQVDLLAALRDEVPTWVKDRLKEAGLDKQTCLFDIKGATRESVLWSIKDYDIDPVMDYAAMFAADVIKAAGGIGPGVVYRVYSAFVVYLDGLNLSEEIGIAFVEATEAQGDDR